MTENRVPVLIVGGGDGGLAASTLLAHHGVHSLLVESVARSSYIPRPATSHFAASRYCAV
jgi:2-polyprenyl-6-methoxyphenol hydroxylase-like FAD-dependent oxidoreductase